MRTAEWIFPPLGGWGELAPLERVVLLASDAAERRGGELLFPVNLFPRRLFRWSLVEVSAAPAERLRVQLTEVGRALVQATPLRSVGGLLPTRLADVWMCPVCNHTQPPPPDVPSGATVTGVCCALCRCVVRLRPQVIWTAEFLSVEVRT